MSDGVVGPQRGDHRTLDQIFAQQIRRVQRAFAQRDAQLRQRAVREASDELRLTIRGQVVGPTTGRRGLR